MDVHTNDTVISSLQVKNYLTDILLDIDQFCEKNRIKYSLAFGTLLGAVRHKGFIPWDDDIDIWMPRPDYERFVKYYSHSYYKVLSPYSTDGYPLEYAKVHDSRTSVREAGEKYGWGISVDIFPVDGIPSKEVGRKLVSKVSRARRVLANQRFTYKLSPSLKVGMFKNLSIVAGKCLHPFVPFKWVVCHIDSIMRSYDYQNCQFVADLCDLNPVFVDKSFLEKFVELEFEGHSFKASAHYDEWLRLIFGDYMQLPPVERRVSVHSVEAYWK